MWLLPQNLDMLSKKSEIIGKATLICQKFEVTCKDVISWFETVRVLEEGTVEFLSDEYLSYVDTLHNILLGDSIKRLTKYSKWFHVSECDLEILQHARISRNWLIHQSGLNTLFRNVELNTEQLIFHVTNVIKGDFLVSKWSYEFYEKESNPWITENEYVDMVLKWILMPMTIEEQLFRGGTNAVARTDMGMVR
jgi:hypothetical protein